MLSPAFLLLGAAAAAFGLFLWIVIVGRERPEAAFARHADTRSWDHHKVPPTDAVQWQARVPQAQQPGDRAGAYFAGPCAAGPFQMWGITAARRAASDQPWAGDRTFIHIRMGERTPPLRFAPAGRFRLEGGPDAAIVDHPAFRRRYEVATEDPDFARRVLDWETCAILAGPPKGVVVDWQGEDLFVVFPVQPRTPAGFETLLTFASALAVRMARQGRAPVRPLSDPALQPLPDATGTAAS